MEMKYEENQKIRDETTSLISKFEALKKFAIEHKILIPPELDSPYEWGRSVIQLRMEIRSRSAFVIQFAIRYWIAWEAL